MSDPTNLPTIAEIEAATEVLSMPDNSAKVVRVNEHFAIKFGNGIPLSEAESMKFLAANSKVPVPKVYKAFVDTETNRTFIIIEYVHGDNLQKLLPSLTPTQKAIICKLVRDALDDLRNIPPPDYLGTLNRQPYYDGVFWTKDYNPLIFSPFASQREINHGILERLRQTEPPQYIRLLENMVDSTLHDHRTVFTHGDLQPKNIMVDEVESFEDGSSSFKITLIDWELAGWYPEYWDFCNATISCRFKPDWLEFIPDILDEYPLEYLMMQVVYSSVFY
ncbi:kinase-like domain-containing protein [Aspergillus transmontanensis]|uniref:Kinase-like domain-containing protein n=1 Tax=Aspergillus transmontanensis TaxID=1034304 RepID=A0A5N6WGR6_9EURO|nr:kinase-like domain-containing protein [Aspergillus transmontanensis]